MQIIVVHKNLVQVLKWDIGSTKKLVF